LLDFDEHLQHEGHKIDGKAAEEFITEI
jgi:hypothetical protein